MVSIQIFKIILRYHTHINNHHIMVSEEMIATLVGLLIIEATRVCAIGSVRIGV